MESVFNFNNTSIRYKLSTKNDKFHIVLLHGFLENLNVFDELFSELSSEYNVLSIDLLGHGNSGFFEEIQSMKLQSQMLASLFSHLDIKKYILIGHSMGGYISTELLKNYSKNIEGICLLNSHTFCDDENTMKKRLDMISLINEGLKEKIINLAIPNIFYKKNEIQIDKLKNIARMCTEKGIINCILGMMERVDTTDIFINSHCKKLFILGKYDSTLNSENIRKTFSNIENITLVEMETGHISFLESPDQTLVLIKKFINEI